MFTEKSAILGRLYYGDNGIVYKGIKGGDMTVWEDKAQVNNIISQTITVIEDDPSVIGGDGLTQPQVSAIAMFKL